MEMNKIIIREFNRLLECDADVRYELNNIVHIINENDEEGDEELRYQIFCGTVTISRVNISKKRCGIFTKLVNKFIENAQSFDIDKIIIQSVSTEEMYRWCLKNGYKEVGNGWGDVLRGDFVRRI